MIIAKVIFNAFKLTWIDIYFGLLDFVVYNHKTNFNFKKFWISFRFIRNTFKLILMKAYYLISKVKRYYYLLYCAYKIVMKKHLKLFNINWLQMVIKVINNIIELNKLSLTLLVFKAYPKIIELNFPNPTIE